MGLKHFYLCSHFTNVAKNIFYDVTAKSLTSNFKEVSLLLLPLFTVNKYLYITPLELVLFILASRSNKNLFYFQN
jgi:hypothetical protein